MQHTRLTAESVSPALGCRVESTMPEESLAILQIAPIVSICLSQFSWYRLRSPQLRASERHKNRIHLVIRISHKVSNDPLNSNSHEAALPVIVSHACSHRCCGHQFELEPLNLSGELASVLVAYEANCDDMETI